MLGSKSLTLFPSFPTWEPIASSFMSWTPPGLHSARVLTLASTGSELEWGSVKATDMCWWLGNEVTGLKDATQIPSAGASYWAIASVSQRVTVWHRQFYREKKISSLPLSKAEKYACLENEWKQTLMAKLQSSFGILSVLCVGEIPLCYKAGGQAGKMLGKQQIPEPNCLHPAP